MKVILSTIIALLMFQAGVSAAQPALPSAAQDDVVLPVRVVEPRLGGTISRYQLEGEVMVSFKLDAAGRPQDIEVVSASHEEAEQPVVNALRRWRFEVNQDKPVKLANARFLLPVRYNPASES